MSKPSIRETIAAARAKKAEDDAKSKTVRGGKGDEREAFIGSGVPGVRKSGPVPRRPTEVELLGHVQKPIKSVIANAKGTGIINISSRELTEVPIEVWNMYHVDPDKIVVDFSSSGGGWYDAVDLTRFVASDNKITHLNARIHEFGALVSVDLRSNELATLPEELGELKVLVNLILSSNMFANIPKVVFRLTTLLDLQLANNQIFGPLDSAIGNLSRLESLDLSENQLTELPQELSNLKAMRKLKLCKNMLTELSVSILSQMPKLTELDISNNQLGCLFSGLGELSEGDGLVLSSLVRLDARNSGLNRITDIGGNDDTSKPRIELKAIKELLLSQNNLSSLENLLFAVPQLYYLDIRANKFTTIPTGVLELSTLRNLDMASNQLEHVPSELGNMAELTTFVWEGNSVRNVPRSTTTTDALMKLLRRRMETDGPSAIDMKAFSVSEASTSSSSSSSSATASQAPASSKTAPTSTAPKKPIQNLNLCKKALSEISKEEILEACSDPQIAALDFNSLTRFPVALQEAVGATLTKISIHHNKISEFPFSLSFPFLTSFDLSDNSMITLGALEDDAAEGIGRDNYPNLNELILTANRLTELPVWLPKTFPKLKTLVASRNKLTAIEPRAMEGLVTLDLSGNEIGTLPPLLGNVRTIKSLILDGNTFRVPRRQVMDQGTEAVMDYLRGRIPPQ
ncbi:hypothetical protein BGZ65_000713 [Modicella reniformis]|uniref:Disease resistance R13L4/SHOC-2-like LRR domain-containing protein n=1 Tax=Modicella reniformis TaxID=1440133 RepID=A0A9P6J6I1_9FUNG|nr:hypothetical protein BGZ65_000713 [Modicella reniformis]